MKIKSLREQSQREAKRKRRGEIGSEGDWRKERGPSGGRSEKIRWRNQTPGGRKEGVLEKGRAEKG